MPSRSRAVLPFQAGGHSNGSNAPPPSTIAAQIVHNRSKVTKQEPESKQIFGKLLQEFLQDPGLEDADLSTNAQLIQVVADAGLDPLLVDNPFSKTGQNEQGSDSLLVIERIITRRPDVLLYASSEDGNLPPLVFWLLAKALRVFGKYDCSNLHARMRSLIEVAVGSLFVNKKTFKFALAFTRLLDNIIEDLLGAVDSYDHTEHLHAKEPQIHATAPSATVLASIWPAVEKLLVLPQGYQIDLRGYPAISFVIVQLTLISTALPGAENAIASSSARSTKIFADRAQRILQTCNANKFNRPEHFRYILNEIGIEIHIQFQRKCHKVHRTPTFRLVATLLTGIISAWPLDSSQPLESILQELIRIAGLDSSQRDKIRKIVLPVVKRAFKSQSSPDELLAALTGFTQHFEANDISPEYARRAAKRQRMTDPSPATNGLNAGSTELRNVISLLDIDKSTTLDVAQEAGRRLRACPLEQQLQLLDSMGHLACQIVRRDASVSDSPPLHCRDCDILSSDMKIGGFQTVPTESDVDRCRILLQVVSFCVYDEPFRSSKPLRIAASDAIRRLSNHLNDAEASQLNFNKVGAWLMSSLQSSSRELRIAAIGALSSYIREDLRKVVKYRNRLQTLNFLRQLTDQDNLAQQETLVLAWSMVGKVCGDEELNLALIHLVGYLGHSQSLVCDAAYQEIRSLGAWHNKTTLDLIRPFWSSIATHVVMDMFAHPQKIQSLSELLNMSVQELLYQTEVETVPYLVLTKRKDVLQRIAQARSARSEVGPVPVHVLWLQPTRNLAAVLALLLSQWSEDPEQTAVNLLREASPTFLEDDLSSMVKVDPIPIACEILKLAGDWPVEKKQHAHQGLSLLADINERRNGGRDQRTAAHLSAFLEAQILGIMSHFTDIIDAPVARQPMAEKKRALRAVEQLIIAGKAQLGIAIPQIRATLQSATKIADLVNLAFMTWSTLVSAASNDDVEKLVDQTFSVIAHFWSAFDPSTQRQAYDTIAELLKTHNAMIRDRIHMLPSLDGVEMLQKFNSEINRFKSNMEPVTHIEAFVKRCRDEAPVIVERALLDLAPFLETQQSIIHESAISQQPQQSIASLIQALLDVVVRFKETESRLPELAAKCLGAIGSIDPNKVDSPRKRYDMLLLSNFERAKEAVEFVVQLLEKVLIDAFRSAPTGKSQTYLAYTMQELLKFCGFRDALYRPKSSQGGEVYHRWMDMSETHRSILTPFLETKYSLMTAPKLEESETISTFKPGISHSFWLRNLVFKLLHKASNDNARMIFPVLARVVRSHDISISTFLLPFVVLNVVIGGTGPDVAAINAEFLNVLSADVDGLGTGLAEQVGLCSENIFQVIDYLSKWLQAKKKMIAEHIASHSRAVAMAEDFDEIKETEHTSSVEAVLTSIPADVISKRAVQCRSFSRALLHWEKYIRQIRDKAKRQKAEIDMDKEFRQLQDIYAQIDEPDCVEGMSTRLQILDPEQQLLEHKRAGRWTAAQSWYELSLLNEPSNSTVQMELLTCLKASNRYGSLLDVSQSLTLDNTTCPQVILPFGIEAAWATGKWDSLRRFVQLAPDEEHPNFNLQIGRILLALKDKDAARFLEEVNTGRRLTTEGLSVTSTSSLMGAQPYTMKLHALYELEQIAAFDAEDRVVAPLVERLDQRLGILGAHTADKQYLLTIRRASMELSSLGFSKQQIASTWLTSASLARKAGLRDAAYDAVLHATYLHEGAAMTEHARLLWQDGHHRKAIQILQGAIENDVFQSDGLELAQEQTFATTTTEDSAAGRVQNFPLAKTQLLLAKWMDRAGHIKSEELRQRFGEACRSFSRWEKGHYYLGKHYLKLLESEKALPRAKQTEIFLTGDVQKLVVENFMRSMVFGAKYYYETVPKMLTLWLDLAADIHSAERNPKTMDQHYHPLKIRKLEQIHKQVKKYIDRLSAYAFYTALPQVTSRINHPHVKANEILLHLINKVVSSHPQQSLWTILAVAKSRANDKASKATTVLNHLKRMRVDTTTVDIKALIAHGERLTNALLAACEHNVESRSSRASLARDLSFNHKLAPCKLVVPVEKALSANLPTGIGGPAVRSHKPFARQPVTIAAFQDDVLVLSSLQRPKKLTMRGTDGELYGLLCKPKDDLRKDQRLMEFTTMIDRGLKRDVESSKRRLYIHTYAVTPLNEECGAIEWVDGLKPMRDIILNNYRARGVRPDYAEIRQLLDRACVEAGEKGAKIFTDQIVEKFPSVMHEWFTETFAEPDAWFTARLRYTRSCAVMSMVGNALGLGDRHGENILLEEGNGGCFHVDFNCLFDKGLTFEKPELVPFRLTHNMLDAFGIYGYEGPFRVAAELTLKTLKQYEDTLMTIMETFVYDPTTDFISKPKKKVPGVPETPAEVLDSVKAKIRGLLPGETVPLSVDGYADALIKMAIDPRRLAGMYIGWCAFF